MAKGSGSCCLPPESGLIPLTVSVENALLLAFSIRRDIGIDNLFIWGGMSYCTAPAFKQMASDIYAGSAKLCNSLGSSIRAACLCCWISILPSFGHRKTGIR